MEINSQSAEAAPQIQWGHFGTIILVAFLLLGMSWFKNPALFTFHKTQNSVAASDVAHYYAYVPSAEDLPQPAVLGAATTDGPQIIGDDGTVHSVDLGQVLGASTQDVVLSLDSIKVNAVPDSQQAIQKYFSDAQTIENGSISNTDFAAALNSGDQTQINQQAQKITVTRDALLKLLVPQSLVKLQKLKIIQYNSTIAMLQNFTQADQNPDLVNSSMQEFLKSQQDLDTENIAVAQKYPNDDPLASSYLNPDGSAAATADNINNFGSAALPQTTQSDQSDGSLGQ